MLWAVLVASGLLLVGFAVRASLRPVQYFYIPASVAGGLIGLVVVQALRGGGAAGEWAGGVAGTLRDWPGLLIAVVFAGLLLEKPGKKLGDAARGAARAGLYAWIVVLGQVSLGLGVCAALILPFFDVPPFFGQLLEAGFAGGHGTAGALGEIYARQCGFPQGRDLGFFMATVGLIYSVVSGIVIVNIAVRRGWTRSGEARVELLSGLEQRRSPKPMAWARVGSEVIDPLAFQFLIVAAAFGLGMLMRWAFIRLAGGVLSDEAMKYVENLPLFLFTLLGGWAARLGMQGAGLGDLIDADSIKRIVAIAMEFLIVAAIASLRIEVVGQYAVPLLVLLLTGFVWTGVCALWLARYLLPRAYWFELGIINYGMSTGTTAQGMMLLRIVDRDLESGAAEDYALAAPLSAPFIGGGVLTMSLPLIAARVPVVLIAAVTGLMVLVLIVVGLLTRGRPAAA